MKDNQRIGDQIGEWLERLYAAKDTVIDIAESVFIVFVVGVILFLLAVKFGW